VGVLDSLWRVPVTVNHGFDRWCHPGGFVLSVMMAYRTGRYRIGREPNQCQEARHEPSTERSHEPDCVLQPPVGQASRVPDCGLLDRLGLDHQRRCRPSVGSNPTPSVGELSLR